MNQYSSTETLDPHLFTNEQLKDVFPFHLIIDSDLRINQIGNELASIMDADIVGIALSNNFHVKGLAYDYSFEQLLEMCNQNCFLQCINENFVLKGRFFETAQADTLLFTGRITQRRRTEERNQLAFKIAEAGMLFKNDLYSFSVFVHQELKKYMDAENFHLTLFDQKTNLINTIYLNDSFNPENETYQRKFSNGLSEFVITANKPLHLKESQLEEFVHKHRFGPKGGIAKVWLMVPLSAEDSAVGVITVESVKNENAYTLEDIQLMEFVSTQVMQVLERQQASEQIEELAKIPDESPNPIVRIDENNRLLYKNAAADSLIQYLYDRNQKLDSSFSSLLNHARTSNLTLEREFELGSKSFLIFITPVEKFGYVNLYLQDITASKDSLRQLEDEKKTSLSYEGKLLRSQLNPHFIFNTLNSLQYYIFEQDVEPGLNFLSDLSKLMRRVLKYSDRDFIGINEEVEFITEYLNIAQSRVREKFTYTITVDPQIEERNLLIPPMLVQPFVENAIIHGVGPLVSDGEIHIDFALTKTEVSCSIRDNGVGFEKAGDLKRMRVGETFDSFANKINSRRLDILNQLTSKEFKLSIEDLAENKETTGTVAILSFPQFEDE